MTSAGRGLNDGPPWWTGRGAQARGPIRATHTGRTRAPDGSASDAAARTTHSAVAGPSGIRAVRGGAQKRPSEVNRPPAPTSRIWTLLRPRWSALSGRTSEKYSGALAPQAEAPPHGLDAPVGGHGEVAHAPAGLPRSTPVTRVGYTPWPGPTLAEQPRVCEPRADRRVLRGPARRGRADQLGVGPDPVRGRPRVTEEQPALDPAAELPRPPQTDLLPPPLELRPVDRDHPAEVAPRDAHHLPAARGRANPERPSCGHGIRTPSRSAIVGRTSTVRTSWSSTRPLPLAGRLYEERHRRDLRDVGLRDLPAIARADLERVAVVGHHRDQRAVEQALRGAAGGSAARSRGPPSPPEADGAGGCGR